MALVFALVGIFVIKAAMDHEPGKAAGFDVALKSIAEAPFGQFLLMAAALGLICFGAYAWPRRATAGSEPDRVERDRGSGCGVERVDATGHRDAHPVVGDRQRAVREPAPSAPRTSAHRAVASAGSSSSGLASSAGVRASTEKPRSRTSRRPPGQVSRRDHGTEKTAPMDTLTDRR